MTAKRLYYALLAGLAGLLVGLVAVTYAITGLLQTKSQQLAANKGQVEQLTTAESGIAKSKRDITTYSELAKVTKAIVPQEKDQAAAVREITNIAAANGVTLTTITFPSSSLGATVAPKAGGAVATPTPAAAIVAKPNLSQLTPVANIPGVYALQITLGNNTNNPVTFNRFNNFLRGLENNRRTAAVSSINIQPQNGNPNNLVFSLIINTYIKP